MTVSSQWAITGSPKKSTRLTGYTPAGTGDLGDLGAGVDREKIQADERND